MSEAEAITNRMELRFLSFPENVALARLAVAGFAGQGRFSLTDLEEIKVAVSEAVSNAVIHGYQNRRDGWISLRAELDGEGLAIEIEDWGVGIADVAKAREPAFSTDPERMGLGFAFMESFMHSLEVISQLGRGTVVRMRRQVNASGAVEYHAR